jgi:ribosome-binding protein aMBF1 (putative translation factor)
MNVTCALCRKPIRTDPHTQAVSLGICQECAAEFGMKPIIPGEKRGSI